MKSKRMRLCFQDEAPRIGCGERGVRVRVGRKYAHVTERASKVTVRMPLPIFQHLAEASARRLAQRKGPRKTAGQLVTVNSTRG